MTRELRQATIIGALAIMAAFFVVGRGLANATSAADPQGMSRPLAYLVYENVGRHADDVTRAAGAAVDRAEANLRQMLAVVRYPLEYASQPTAYHVVK